jgi:hypothetical protein
MRCNNRNYDLLGQQSRRGRESNEECKMKREERKKVPGELNIED